MKVEKDYFVKYYNQTIKPEVLKFEKQHKEILKKYTKLKSNAGNKSSYDLVVKPILRFNIFFIGLVFFIFFSNFLFSKAPGLVFIIMLLIFFVGLPIACASGIGSVCFNIYCYGKKNGSFYRARFIFYKYT